MDFHRFSLIFMEFAGLSWEGAYETVIRGASAGPSCGAHWNYVSKPLEPLQMKSVWGTNLDTTLENYYDVKKP